MGRKPGEPLVILVAMGMEHEIVATAEHVGRSVVQLIEDPTNPDGTYKKSPLVDNNDLIVTLSSQKSVFAESTDEGDIVAVHVTSGHVATAGDALVDIMDADGSVTTVTATADHDGLAMDVIVCEGQRVVPGEAVVFFE